MKATNRVNSFNYYYGQGGITVLEVLDPKTFKKDFWLVSAAEVSAFYDYIKPETYKHTLREMYTSRSGASGHGKIYSEDLIFLREVAYYRENATEIGGDTTSGIFLPVTYDYGSGFFNYNCPIVFAKMSDSGVPQAHFMEIKKDSVGREIETFILYNKNEILHEGSLRWELFTNGESGVDALRILLSYFYIDAFIEEEEEPKKTEWKLQTKTPAEEFFLKGLSKFSKGGIEMFFAPRSRKFYNGESYKDAEFFVQTNTWLPSGIELGNNYELYYRTNETDRMDAIVQKNIKGEWYEYEFSCHPRNIVESIKVAKKSIKTKWLVDQKAARESSRAIENAREILHLLEGTGIILDVQDSYDVGNCEAGTKAFADKYFPGKTTLSAEDILEHEFLEEILSNKQFTRVLLNKYGQKNTEEEN